MSLKLKIKCDFCKDEFIEDFNKILNYRGIRPGLEWGIDKVRFYALPTVYCINCHSVAILQLFEEEEKIMTTKKPVRRLEV